MPDHGYGPLGQAAHGLLRAGTPPDRPALALVYNALSDPPGPVRCSEFDLVPEFWQVAGEDMHRYLILLARGIRDAPPPDPTASDDERPVTSPPTRLDGLALVFPGAAVRPEKSSAGKALAANLTEGYYRRGDVAASPAAERTMTALAVDREDNALIFFAHGGQVGPAVPGPPDRQQIAGPLVEELTDLLAALWSMMERAEALMPGDSHPDR